jgi:uncharacterized protein YjiS (DUF1127 family)
MIKLATFPAFPFAKPERSRRRRWFAELWAGAADGLNMQAHYDRLSRLSKSELAQLGLTRDDISRVVVRGRK